MKKAIDKFSNQALHYKKFRPDYPSSFYKEILQHLVSKEMCWDCGTGNGQVAVELSKHFDEVYATDISEEQIKLAEKRKNIFYNIERAEKTQFKDNQFDLITVAQAIHWFDIIEFNKEVKRVGKNGGILALWTYGLLRIKEPIDEIIDNFYTNIVGPFWNEERKMVDDQYKSIPFDFNELEMNQHFISVNWNFEQLIGYLNSWSSVQNYKDTNPNTNPVNFIIKDLKNSWLNEEKKQVKFPIFTRVGRIEK